MDRSHRRYCRRPCGRANLEAEAVSSRRRAAHGSVSGRHARETVALGDGQAVAYPVPSSSAVSSVMRRNRKHDTRPELAVRRLLYARGRRYRVAPYLRLAAGISVRPDVVFLRQRVVVFIDGCFWHGCPEHGTTPRVNADYWGPKIARNRFRDERNTAALEAEGWFVVRAWEHEPAEDVIDRVERALKEALGRPARYR